MSITNVIISAFSSIFSDRSLGQTPISNIANIALILGVVAMLRPVAVQARVIRIDAPIMILVSLALLAVLFNGAVSRLEGFLLLMGLVAYIVFTFLEAPYESDRIQEEFASAARGRGAGIAAGIFRVALGLALLVGGGHILVKGAVELAMLLGMK